MQPPLRQGPAQSATAPRCGKCGPCAHVGFRCWLRAALTRHPDSRHARGRPRAANMYALNILHYQLCYTSGLHHNLTILLSASLSNLQRIRRNFSGEDITASKALVCRTPQARHAPPTQDDGHPMPPVSSVCHRAHKDFKNAFPPHRRTGFPQPPATYYPRTAPDKHAIRRRDQRGEARRPNSSTSPACAQQRHHRLSTVTTIAEPVDP
eukprot:COSAG06_NODE_5506_length_3438_cov_6.845632_2_plen_209_part_00